MTLTPTQITEIRERCAKATAGPWHHRQAGIVRNEQELDWIADKAERGLHHKIIVQRQSLYGGSADYAFISHARTDLPAALDTIDEMGREIAESHNAALERAAHRIEQEAVKAAQNAQAHTCRLSTTEWEREQNIKHANKWNMEKVAFKHAADVIRALKKATP